VASITGVPVTVLAENEKIKMCEINFLCVHKGYREYKMAALLISEVTRRVNLRDKWQAVKLSLIQDLYIRKNSANALYSSYLLSSFPQSQETYRHQILSPSARTNLANGKEAL
jgi:hypothetical protein